MRSVRLLLLAAAFLIMVACILTILYTPERLPVYVSIGAMVCIAIALGLMNFKSKPKDIIQ